jgi:hypothetical protein
MMSLRGIQIAGLLLALSSGALSQDLSSTSPVNIVPNSIDYIPPLAKAVLSRDQQQVIKALEAGDDVNAQVRAKDGARAGFTPIILAATLSDAGMAKVLLRYKASITILDDYHRSAFWYAALRGSLSTAEALNSASDVSDVINKADDDLRRTPLHLAVRGDSLALVQLLIKMGASASKEDKDILDETPIEYCKRHYTTACKGL